GIEVEREPRDIVINAIELHALTGNSMTLDVTVSRGTYVRTLVEDIARAWGGAAHVSALRRTGVGTYTTAAMFDFEQLELRAKSGPDVLDAALVPASRALADWPTVVLTREGASDVSHGRTVDLQTKPDTIGRVRIMNA